MTDELLAYLMDDLSPERRAAVDERLSVDAAWRSEFERLRECLAATNQPELCVEEPPADLLVRTCGLVERAGALDLGAPSSRGRVAALTAVGDLSAGGGSQRWSMADCAVGVAVLVMLSMLTLPALRESREAARRQVCQDRLRALGAVLFKYQRNHNKQLPAVNPGEPAGMFAVELAERAGVPKAELEQILICPETEEAQRRFEGEAVPHIPTRAELAAARGLRRVMLVRTMGGSVAYRIGYYDKQHGYHVTRFTGGDDQPMCADAPSVSRSGVHSLNHGGGQNVLDQSMRVVFLTNWFWNSKRDNIYLNFAGKPAAGDDEGDVVLSRSDYGPDGHVVELGAE